MRCNSELMAGVFWACRPDLQYVATMKKGESAVDTLAAAVADLWRKGASIAWPVAPAPAPGPDPERGSVLLSPQHAQSVACSPLDPACISGMQVEG